MADLTVVLLLVQVWTSVPQWLVEVHCTQQDEAQSQAAVNEIASLLFESDAGPGLAVF